ncbi:MAG: hypothetical protein A2V81_04880 [Candidatus Abawacabacteria bacterium RBG_16_42_10]|uniref:Addiction module toxin RelE n=1 Tax=Candidatus Abawacabacteria bacterium RBG_16_42_10 TaxID=1817814 RepID=A0A1F4XIL9_9BACT|nr:MAG: hypothetical protein A2V81_04880 [Candidatus Abawacabacteria bacterium RBG_16_42_10]
MKFIYTKGFQKSFEKLSPKQQSQVENTLKKFALDPLNIMLKNHALHGKLTGFRAIKAANDLRIVFREEQGYIFVVLINVGTHNQIY